jgi:SAM-dependent methyltransferase
VTTYVGGELDLFAHAENWKARLRREIAPFLVAPALEVGAGIGATTATLRPLVTGSWIGLEPDPALAARLGARRELTCLPVVGTLAAIEAHQSLQTVLYVDVLEHIADDRSEVDRAAALLAPGGRLVVLAPAVPSLYSEFDRAIGHHRRYSRRALLDLQPAGFELERVRSLDALGMFLNLGNRLVSKQSLPTLAQIRFWDRLVVPCGRLLDPLLGYRFGRSIVAVWRRRAA